MNILEDLKLAHDTQNWDKIREIYKDLSGNTLEVIAAEEKPKRGRGRPRKATTGIISSESVTIDTNIESYPISDNTQNINAAKIIIPETELNFRIKHNSPTTNSETKKMAKTVPFEPGRFKQTFKDTLKEHSDESVANMPELGTKPNHVGKPRENSNEQKVTVKCSKCGKVEEVLPMFSMLYSDIPEENAYRCNDCIRG